MIEYRLLIRLIVYKNNYVPKFSLSENEFLLDINILI